MTEKFEFDQVIEGVRTKEEDVEIELRSDDEEESSKENHVIAID